MVNGGNGFGVRIVGGEFVLSAIMTSFGVLMRLGIRLKSIWDLRCGPGSAPGVGKCSSFVSLGRKKLGLRRQTESLAPRGNEVLAS